METDGSVEDLVEGLSISANLDDFRTWAGDRIAMISVNQQGEHPYHRLWAEERIEEVERAMEQGLLPDATDREHGGLPGTKLAPGSHHTIFLMLDRLTGG